MRCYRGLKAIGIDQVIGCGSAAQGLDRQGIIVFEEASGLFYSTRSYGLHARGGHSLQLAQVHESPGDQGLAAVSVGAGDEKLMAQGDGFRLKIFRTKKRLQVAVLYGGSTCLSCHLQLYFLHGCFFDLAYAFGRYAIFIRQLVQGGFFFG